MKSFRTSTTCVRFASIAMACVLLCTTLAAQVALAQTEFDPAASKGRRAISIPVNELFTLEAIKPGYRVDILSKRKSTASNHFEIKTLIWNVKLLERDSKMVTIEVLPMQAQLLFSAINNGNDLFMTSGEI